MEDMIEAVEDFFVVGNGQDSSLLFGRHPAEEIHDDASTMRIECRGGFVSEDDPGAIGQSARDRHPLRLTT